MGCIYGIRNDITLKWYIGKCVRNVIDRKRAHFRGYGNKPLYNAIKKHGAENFTFHILLDGIIADALPNYEIEYIKAFNSKIPHGYNLTDGGEGALNPTQETIEKRVKHRRGVPRPKEVCDKISASHIGIRPNAETRAKQSAAKKGKSSHMKGKKHKKESKAKMSAAKLGKPMSEETRKKISNTLSGVPKTPYSEPAKELYLSLPPDLSIPEKRKVIREKYSGLVEKSTVYYWVKKWQSESD